MVSVEQATKEKELRVIRQGAKQEAQDFMHWFIWQKTDVKRTNSEWLLEYSKMAEQTKETMVRSNRCGTCKYFHNDRNTEPCKGCHRTEWKPNITINSKKRCDDG